MNAPRVAKVNKIRCVVGRYLTGELTTKRDLPDALRDLAEKIESGKLSVLGLTKLEVELE